LSYSVLGHLTLEMDTYGILGPGQSCRQGLYRVTHLMDHRSPHIVAIEQDDFVLPPCSVCGVKVGFTRMGDRGAKLRSPAIMRDESFAGVMV